MHPGHKIIAERAERLARLTELEQTLEAIEAVLRASGCEGDTTLELATYAAEKLTDKRTNQEHVGDTT